MTTETVTRHRMDVLKEIRLILLEAFLIKGYKNLVHYTLSKERYEVDYFDLKILHPHFETRETTWVQMLEALKRQFGKNAQFNTIDEAYQHIRILVGDECTLRQGQPVMKLPVVEEFVDVVEQPPETVGTSTTVAPSTEEKPRSVKAVSSKIKYDKGVLVDLYIKLYLSLQTESGMKLGRDFMLSNPDGKTLEFKFAASQSSKLKPTSTERVEITRKHFEEKFGADSLDPYFPIKLSSDPARAEVIVLNVADEYYRRCKVEQ